MVDLTGLPSTPNIANLPSTTSSVPTLSGGTSFLTNYISNQTSSLNSTVFSATKRSNDTAAGQLNASVNNRVSGAATDQLSSNPLGALGADTLNSAVTQVTQQLLSTGTSKLETAVNQKVGFPVRQTVDDVMNGYFSIVGLISTAGVEIALELARVNARSILTLVGQKNTIIAELQALVIQLNNAMAIISNSSPFFSAYYQKLITAYNDINTADVNFKSIVNVLKTTGQYEDKLYSRSLALLNTAQSLILPPPQANVSAIFSPQMLTQILGIQSVENALTSALMVPVISAKLGLLYIQYVETTLEINGLIALFLVALNSYITSFQKSPAISQNTINHINAGTLQLDSLLADMKVMLFPSATAPIARQSGQVQSITTANGVTSINVIYIDASTFTFTTTLTPVVGVGNSFQAGQQLAQDARFASASFQGKITTSATAWGIRLAAIIQWMTVEPGLASKSLDMTGLSVQQYEAAIAALKAQGNIKSGVATLTVTQSQESLINTTEAISKILLFANTVVASQNSPATVKQVVGQLNSIFAAALELDASISKSLSTFVNSPSALAQSAGAVVTQLQKFTKDLGLDRAADTLAKADFTTLFNMTGSTATYAGAGVAGVTAIIAALQSNPNTSQSDISTLQQTRTNMQTQVAAKQVESTRSSSSSSDLYIAQQTAMTDANIQQAQSAIAIAQNNDPTIQSNDQLQQAQNAVGSANGNRYTFAGYS